MPGSKEGLPTVEAMFIQLTPPIKYIRKGPAGRLQDNCQGKPVGTNLMGLLPTRSEAMHDTSPEALCSAVTRIHETLRQVK